MSERQQALLEAAAYAEFYGNERFTLCGDSILHDPVFDGSAITPEAVAKSRELQIEGTINSAAYHAATQIAEHLRTMAGEPVGASPFTPPTDFRLAEVMEAQAFSAGFKAGFEEALRGRLWRSLVDWLRGRR